MRCQPKRQKSLIHLRGLIPDVILTQTDKKFVFHHSYYTVGYSLRIRDDFCKSYISVITIISKYFTHYSDFICINMYHSRQTAGSTAIGSHLNSTVVPFFPAAARRIKIVGRDRIWVGGCMFV